MTARRLLLVVLPAVVEMAVLVPITFTGLVLMVLLTVTNLFSVRAYGEFEFWFASIKVAAILAAGALTIRALADWWLRSKQLDIAERTAVSDASVTTIEARLARIEQVVETTAVEVERIDGDHPLLQLFVCSCVLR